MKTKEQLENQVLVALARANEVRTQRAQDKRAIKRGQLDAAVILRNPPPHWRSACLYELLLAVPRVGRIKAQRWCRLEFISLTATLRSLTERQRTVLARQLDLHTTRFGTFAR